MTEKFYTTLTYDQVSLDQIYQLIEAGEMVKGVGLARLRLDGLQQLLTDVENVLANHEYKEINRHSWEREAQRLTQEITELKKLAYLVN